MRPLLLSTLLMLLLPSFTGGPIGEYSKTLPAINPLAYVDPFIGTGGHGHTFPGATAPFGMVQLSPDTRISTMDWDGCSGYHYSDTLVYGFSHTHLSGTGVPDYCDILAMPYTGKAYLEPSEYASAFQKSQEHAEAGYYSVDLEKGHIKAELTATERVGVHRYTYPQEMERGKVLFDLRHRDEVLESGMTVVSDREVVGFRHSKGWAQDQRLFFVIRFSKPMLAGKVLDMSQSPRVSQRTVRSKQIVGLFDFDNDEQPLVVTVGISAVSVDNARANLAAECNHFDFDRVKAETQGKWLQHLSKINVEGGTEQQLRIFYTALYHSMVAPNLYSDVDASYRGRDMQLYTAQNHKVYTVFSLWDTYRACNPLYTILEPDRVNDFIQTFLVQYRQGGRLPIWELSANETDCMIGNHAIPVIADAYAKGIRNYDARLALQAMKTSALQDRLGLQQYKTLGYIPSDQEPESVSKTLEYAFDDWSIAVMAKALGDQAGYQQFIARAQNYKNLFDPATGFFRARNNATWYAPFDPYEVNFNYTEANAWQYRFAAPQDVSGMMRLAGGPEGFAARLDSLFEAKAATTGRTQADITGLIGQYVQGNEPSHHMAYLYNFAGQPWKTQTRVRQILDQMYTDKPDGLSGNEDCGQMSAWLVFSALGFYPAVPVGGQYTIGTPWFEEVDITLDNGKIFSIRAPGASAKKKYIKSVQWNGRPWTKSWIDHQQITSGGVLTFEMSEKPTDWGRAEADRPVSAITDAPIVPMPFVRAGKRVFSERDTVVLGCLDPEAVIYYAVQRQQAPAPVSYDSLIPYTSPVVLTESAELVFAAKRGNVFTPMQKASFSKMNSSLKIVRYGTRYNNQYTGRGDNGLIDLLEGGADFRSGGWQGYEGVDLDVVIDMGVERLPGRVAANFLQDENSWIFYPARVRFEISSDGTHFTPLGVVENSVSPSEKGTLQQKFSLQPTGAAGRYLRVVGESLKTCPAGHKGAGNPCWLFVDEIYVE